ncbi:MAG TPA: hypothetical protein VFW27_04285 [Actinoplanes sp.]|nr:hypothetical protein [Actinoplanes sp.]
MRTRVALVATGAVLIAYAIGGALADDGADPIGMAVFLLAVLVAHDAVWMPVVLAIVAVAVRVRIRKKPRPGNFRKKARPGGVRKKPRPGNFRKKFARPVPPGAG